VTGVGGEERPRRVVITVCPRERGTVRLPLERGRTARRLDAEAVGVALEACIATRGLEGRVSVRSACAGGCLLAGPNVSVVIYPLTPEGEKPDHVAVGWKSYVGTLDTLSSLADVVDGSVSARDARTPRRRADPSRRR
jgi:hypothetical protein